jgi:DNA-binding NtrC family response regulator
LKKEEKALENSGEGVIMKKVSERKTGKTKPRILVVDDNEDIRKILTKILVGEGYIVDSAETGMEAIRKTEQKFYNLALIDIRLPDIEGVELLTKIKETKPKMRKVIITGYPTLQNAVKALNRGADAYIMKPLDMDRMLATIVEQLEKQREEQEMTEKQLVTYIETRVNQYQIQGEKHGNKKRRFL